MAQHRVQLGLPVAHEPAHRRAVRHHPAGARVAVRGHGRVHVRPPALRERPQRHAQLLPPSAPAAWTSPARCAPRSGCWTQIAKRLGDEVVEGYNPRMKDVAVAGLGRRPGGHLQGGLREVGRQRHHYGLPRATTIVPPGRSSTPTRSSAPEIDEPYYPFKSALDKGESPFNTPTKKIEFASNFVKTHDMTESRWRGRIDPMPVWSPSYVEGDISSSPPTTASTTRR